MPNLGRFLESDALDPGEGQPLGNGLSDLLAGHVGLVLVTDVEDGPYGGKAFLNLTNSFNDDIFWKEWVIHVRIRIVHEIVRNWGKPTCTDDCIVLILREEGGFAMSFIVVRRL